MGTSFAAKIDSSGYAKNTDAYRGFSTAALSIMNQTQPAVLNNLSKTLQNIANSYTAQNSQFLALQTATKTISDALAHIPAVPEITRAAEEMSRTILSLTPRINEIAAAAISPLQELFTSPLIPFLPATFPTFISPEVPYNLWLAFKNDPPLDWLHQVLYEEGTALYEVANPLLINKLYQASSPRGRKQVLAHNLDLILNDCLNISSQKGRSKEECRYSAVLQGSLKAIKSGSPTSGLSLIGALLDELNTTFIVPNYFNATSGGPQDRVHGKRRWDNHSDLTLRAQIALKPLPHWFRRVYKKSANDSQWDKRGFSRHRIAHHPSSALITKSNCAQAALAATSIMALIFEWKPQY